MRKRLYFRYLIFLVVFMSACAFGGVNSAQARVLDKGTTHYVTGDIGKAGETVTWYSGNTYVLCCINGTYETPYVLGNLVIQPGVIVEFGNSFWQGPRVVAQSDWNTQYERFDTNYYSTSKLYVTTGNIKAEGTKENPIIFRLTAGDKTYTNGWEGLRFNSDEKDMPGRYGIFKYCNFENFGCNTLDNGGIVVSSSNPVTSMMIDMTFENCNFNSSSEELVVGDKVINKECNNAIYIQSMVASGTLTINNCTFNSGCCRDVLTNDINKMNFIANNNKFDGQESLVNWYGTGHVNVSDNNFMVRGKEASALDLGGRYSSLTYADSVIIEGNTYDVESTEVATYYPVSVRVESEVNAPEYKTGSYRADTFSEKYPEKKQRYRMIGTIAADKTCTIYNNLCRTIVVEYFKNNGTTRLMPGVSIDYGTRGCDMAMTGGSIIAQGTENNTIKIFGAYGYSVSEQKSVILNYCELNGYNLRLNRTDGCEISVKNSKFTSDYSKEVISIYNAVDESITSKAIFENITVNSYDGIHLTNANNVEFNNCRIIGKNTNDYAIGVIIDGAVADDATSPVFNNLLIYNIYQGIGQNSDTYTSVKINNATITKCQYGVVAKLLDMKNSIVYGNSNYDIRFIGDIDKFASDYISYCCINKAISNSQGFTDILLKDNTNLINVNPQFADSDKDDFHLKSPFGRWNGTGFVVTDTSLSPCINAGSTSASYKYETEPNGNIVNMGYYGNTTEASRFSENMTYILNTAITGVTDAVYWDECKKIATPSEDAYYTITSVTWSPDGDYRFDKNIVYTLTIKLRANNRQNFAKDFTATINGKEAVVAENTGSTVTLTYTYPSTGVTITADAKPVNGTTTKLHASVSPADRATQSQEVTWTTSDETIASVDEEGNLSAKKVGTVTITATAKDGSGKLGTISFNIRPAVVTSLKATATAYNTIKLTWAAVTDATAYEIYRATSLTGTYSLIKGDCNALTYTDTTCETGTTYYYKVVAIASITSGTDIQKVSSPDSDVVNAKPVLDNVTGTKAACYNYNTNKITWTKVAGASGYVIYRSTSKSGTYSKFAVIKNGLTTVYNNGGLATGTTYYYKIKAYRQIGTKYLYSPSYSSIVYAKPVLKTPTGVKAASAGYSSIKVSWSAVAGANGYKIYRATSKNGTYSLIKTITSGTTKYYTNSSLTTGKTYYYKVVAYRKVSSKTVTTTSAKVSAYAKPSTPAVKASKSSSTKIKVSWGRVSGASGYVVYRATSKNGTYTTVKTVTSGKTISYSNSGLKKGKTYYYKVRTYRTVSGKKVYSSYSAVKYVKL